jgi:hypothetical protein
MNTSSSHCTPADYMNDKSRKVRQVEQQYELTTPLLLLLVSFKREKHHYLHYYCQQFQISQKLGSNGIRYFLTL